MHIFHLYVDEYVRCTQKRLHVGWTLRISVTNKQTNMLLMELGKTNELMWCDWLLLISN